MAWSRGAPIAVRGADELVGGGPRPAMSPAASRISTAAARTAHSVAGAPALLQHAAHGGDGRRDLSLGQPQQRHARRRLPAVFQCGPVSAFGVGGSPRSRYSSPCW